ncbi:phosphate uptake regulator PhoU [Candidatus Woesearchaeota archaeon]|nr:phosphate uptake regulator PhoU [Candidatus Woesearchaeota archaeon]
MKRKVIKLAKNTLVLSLPAAWCKANQVNKGDELSCEHRSSQLTITKNASGKKATTIDGDALGVLLKRAINELYHAGVDRITIRATKPETQQRLGEALNQLLGLHVVEQRASTIIVEDLAKTDQDWPSLFRRFLLLIKTMFDDGIAAIEANDAAECAAIANRDTDVNKFGHLCLRALQKQPFAPDETARLHTLLYLTEQLGDDLKNILRSPAASAVLPALPSANALYAAATHFFFQRTLTNAHAVAHANDEATQRASKLAVTNETAVPVIRLHSFIKKAVSIQELFLHELQDAHHATIQ